VRRVRDFHLRDIRLIPREARAVTIGVLSAIAPTAGPAAEAAPIRQAIAESRPILDLRMRSENVSQDGLPEDSHALTLRGRIGFESGKVFATSLLAEAELLWPLDDRYNSTLNGRTTHPVVADPESYEINRLQIVNTALPGTAVTLGRQRVSLDDHRFVGNVGWRQNEQTFDAVRIVNGSIAHLTLDVTYINQVNRIVGSDSPVGRYEGDSYLVNAAYTTRLGKVSGFVHRLQFDQIPGDESETLGLRWIGERPLGVVTLAWKASYASQEERENNPLDYRLSYEALELTGIVGAYEVGAGMEVLEGNGTKGFSTPLATLHQFQGWADKFLITPADGIDDRYVLLGWKKKRAGAFESLSAMATYHRYESERSGVQYGSELNLRVQAKWRSFTGMLKYAAYDAEGFSTDTRNVGVQLEYVW
jgi:hypothetical protein